MGKQYKILQSEELGQNDSTECDAIILKYELPKGPGLFSIEMPSALAEGRAGIDPNGVPCLWVACRTQKDFIKEQVYLLTFTGDPFPSGGYTTNPGVTKWIGTYEHGGRIFHLFYLGQRKVD